MICFNDYLQYIEIISIENLLYKLYYTLMDNKKKLGKRIKEIRKRKGLTQEKLAELIGLEQNTISVIESGRNFPTLLTLEKMSKILGVELSDFFNYDPLDDISEIKRYTDNRILNMSENELKLTYKFIRNIIC